MAEEDAPATKTVIGRTETVDFPQLGLLGIAAKVDTGAMTSSIHCADVQQVEHRGRPAIAFTLLDPDHPEYTGRRLHAARFATTTVRNSFGGEQQRYVITSDVVVSGRLLTTEFTLADRESMAFPVLLGRRLLRGNFLVDVELVHATSSVEE